MLWIALGILAVVLGLALLICPFAIGFKVLKIPRGYRVPRCDRFRQIYVSDLAGLMFLVALFLAPSQIAPFDGAYMLFALIVPAILWYVCFTYLRDAAISDARQRAIYCVIAMPITWISSFALLFLLFGWLEELHRRQMFSNDRLIPVAALLCADLVALVLIRRYVRWMFTTYGRYTPPDNDSIPLAELV